MTDGVTHFKSVTLHTDRAAPKAANPSVLLAVSGIEQSFCENLKSEMVSNMFECAA